MAYAVRTFSEVEMVGERKSEELEGLPDVEPGANLESGLNYFAREGWTFLESVRRDGEPWLIFHKPGKP